MEGYGGRSSDALAEVRQRRGGERRPRLDPSALHEGQQLVGDLGQDVFGQPGHAEDLVPRPVDVVSERDELEAGGQEGDGSHSNPQPRPDQMQEGASLICCCTKINSSDFFCTSLSSDFDFSTVYCMWKCL